jgi:hypothetical protein
MSALNITVSDKNGHSKKIYVPFKDTQTVEQLQQEVLKRSDLRLTGVDQCLLLRKGAELFSKDTLTDLGIQDQEELVCVYPASIPPLHPTPLPPSPTPHTSPSNHLSPKKSIKKPKIDKKPQVSAESFPAHNYSGSDIYAVTATGFSETATLQKILFNDRWGGSPTKMQRPIKGDVIRGSPLGYWRVKRQGQGNLRFEVYPPGTKVSTKLDPSF